MNRLPTPAILTPTGHPLDPTSDRRAENIAAKYRGVIVWRPQDGGPCAARAVPTDAERAILVERREQIERILQPMRRGDLARVSAAVASMLGGGYSSLKNTDPRDVIAGYVEALQQHPAWAVERACAAVRAGTVEGLSPDWPPTHARLCLIASGQLWPMIEERGDIDMLLSLKLASDEVDEASQERRNAQGRAWIDRTDPAARDLAQHGSAAASADQERRREEINASNEVYLLRQYAAAGVKPLRDGHGMLISLSLARNLGIIPRQEATP